MANTALPCSSSTETNDMLCYHISEVKSSSTCLIGYSDLNSSKPGSEHISTHTHVYRLARQKQFQETMSTPAAGWHTPDLTNCHSFADPVMSQLREWSILSTVTLQGQQSALQKSRPVNIAQ